MTPPWLLAPWALAVGACVASFVTTAAVRSVRGEPFLGGRSHCDGCGAPLSLIRTVPVLSYVGLRGACSGCGARIDPAHPLGEITGGLLVLAAVEATPLPQALLISALGMTLLAAAVIDLRTQTLPDLLTLAAAALCAGLALTHGIQALACGAASAALAFVLLEAVRRGFILVKRKPGLGFGDVKLIAALAFWLGAATPWAVVAASIGGLSLFAVTRPKDGRIAFGPMIAASAWSLGLVKEAGWWP